MIKIIYKNSNTGYNVLTCRRSAERGKCGPTKGESGGNCVKRPDVGVHHVNQQ